MNRILLLRINNQLNLAGQGKFLRGVGNCKSCQLAAIMIRSLARVDCARRQVVEQIASE